MAKPERKDESEHRERHEIELDALRVIHGAAFDNLRKNADTARGDVEKMRAPVSKKISRLPKKAQEPWNKVLGEWRDDAVGSIAALHKHYLGRLKVANGIALNLLYDCYLLGRWPNGRIWKAFEALNEPVHDSVGAFEMVVRDFEDHLKTLPKF